MLASTFPPNLETDIIVAKGYNSKIIYKKKTLISFPTQLRILVQKLFFKTTQKFEQQKSQLPLSKNLSQKNGTMLPQLTNILLLSL